MDWPSLGSEMRKKPCKTHTKSIMKQLQKLQSHFVFLQMFPSDACFFEMFSSDVFGAFNEAVLWHDLVYSKPFRFLWISLDFFRLLSTGRNDFWQTDAYFITFLILILSFPCHFAEIMEAVAALCSTLKILKWPESGRMWQAWWSWGRYPKIAEYFQVTLVEALPGLLTMFLISDLVIYRPYGLSECKHVQTIEQ